jgi:hypothetical protein
MTTTTIETEAATRIPAAGLQTERAVFVTDDDYRSRRLAQAAIAVGALACLWFAGLGIGTLGLGGLPAVTLPIPGGGGDQPQPAVDRANDVTPARPRPTPGLAAARPSTTTAAPYRASTGPRASQRNHARAKAPGTAPASRNAGAKPVPAAPGNQPAQPTTARRVRRGLERRGLSAPPGQVQRETRPQPAAAPPGQEQRLGDPETTAPLPPGQQKPDKPPPPG